MSALNQLLEQGLNEIGVALPEQAQALMLAHLDMLSRWNKVHNLTRINQKSDMVYFHLLDSLAISPYLEGKRFIDVGTGAGFPGMPLAIAHPDKEFILLDSNQKKAHFLNHLLSNLKINNVNIICSRAERYTPNPLFDGILVRAAASIDTILPHVRHLKGRFGRIYIMTVNDFSLPANDGLHVEKEIPLTVPQINDRKLVILNTDQI